MLPHRKSAGKAVSLPTWKTPSGRLSESSILKPMVPTRRKRLSHAGCNARRKRNAAHGVSPENSIHSPLKLFNMQQEDDLRGLAKVMEFMRAISIVFVVIHVYWFCYRAFVDAGINIGVVDKILLNFQRTAGLFSNLLVTKVFAVIFLALSCLGTKGVKNQKMTWRKIYTAFLSGLVLFFMNWWMLDLPFNPTVNAAIYTVTLTAGYILLLMSGVWISRMLKHNLMEDVFNTANESFMQETRFMENEYSVNLPTKFVYQGKEWDGWINVVNDFSCVHRAWNTGQREILRGGKQLHQTANREILCHVHL